MTTVTAHPAHIVTGATVAVGDLLSVGHGTSHWRNVQVIEVGEPQFYGQGFTTAVKYHDGTSDVIVAGTNRARMLEGSTLGVVCSWMTVPA